MRPFSLTSTQSSATYTESISPKISIWSTLPIFRMSWRLHMSTIFESATLGIGNPSTPASSMSLALTSDSP